MASNRILGRILAVAGLIVIPFQLVTTLVLGILVTVSFGLLLLPISLLWVVLIAPLLGASWICRHAPVLRNAVGFVGLPWAVLANTYACLMPSMGEFGSRAARLMLTESWPFSWEFWRFQTGQLDYGSADATQLREVLRFVTSGDPLRSTVVARIAAREPIDA